MTYNATLVIQWYMLTACDGITYSDTPLAMSLLQIVSQICLPLAILREHVCIQTRSGSHAHGEPTTNSLAVQFQEDKNNSKCIRNLKKISMLHCLSALPGVVVT